MEKITAHEVAEAARRGDLHAQEILRRAGTFIGIAIAGLINLFNPSIVIIGGGVAQVGDILTAPIRQAVRERVMHASEQSVRITTGFVPQEKTLKQLWFLIGLGVLVLFVVLVLIILLSNRPSSLEMQTWIQQYHMVPLSAVLFGLPALVAAVFLGLKRFYLYAMLTFGLPALGAWLNIKTFIPILATGLVVLAFGIGLLSSFLKQHPVDEKAGGNVGG